MLRENLDRIAGRANGIRREPIVAAFSSSGAVALDLGIVIANANNPIDFLGYTVTTSYPASTVPELVGGLTLMGLLALPSIWVKDKAAHRGSEDFLRGNLDVQRPTAIVSGLIAGGLTVAENIFSASFNSSPDISAIVGGIVSVASAFAIGSIAVAMVDSIRVRNAANRLNRKS